MSELIWADKQWIREKVEEAIAGGETGGEEGRSGALTSGQEALTGFQADDLKQVCLGPRPATCTARNAPAEPCHALTKRANRYDIAKL